MIGGTFFRSRGFRKFRRNRLALLASMIILAYVGVAVAVMFFDLIPRDATFERVGSGSVPGFGSTQDPEKRFADCDFRITLVERGLKRRHKAAALA